MEPYTRLIRIKVTVDIWDWDKESTTNTLDITREIMSYQFQKSIKNVKGACTIQLVPQTKTEDIFNLLSNMDVVKVYEFDTLKFQGYITRVSYSGSISPDGKPSRACTISVTQMGGLLFDAKTGLGLGVAIGNPDGELYIQNVRLVKAIADAVNDKATYKDLIILLLDVVKDYVKNLGGTAILTYLEEYLSYGKAITGDLESVVPRSFEFFTGMEQSVSLWQILDQLIEKPFFEMFIDNGPRSIELNGNKVTLGEGSHIIFRPTPFDGTVGGGASTLFTDYGSVYIDKDHLVRVDLSKSMEEVNTVYLVKHAAFQLSDLARQYLGRYKIDESRLKKYLFRPLAIDRFYTRDESIDETAVDGSVSKVRDNADDLSETLKEWYTHNDEYVSGAITLMVPENSDNDPKIGDKVEMYGIAGFFYVEGVAHKWSYSGALTSNLSVTRGFNGKNPIELSGKLFHRRIV